MSYTNSFTVATLPAFQHRVEMCLYRLAYATLGDALKSQPEQNLAKQILDNASGYSVTVAKALCAQEVAQVLMDADQTGANVDDPTLDAQVLAAFIKFIR